MEVLWALCERAECAAECLHRAPVMEKLLAPVAALLGGQQVRASVTCGELNMPLLHQI